MTDIVHGGAAVASRESAIGCTAALWITSVMRAAHRLWRHDTPTKVRAHTKASRRTVAYWMSRRTAGMSADHLVALMRAEPAHFVPAVLGPDAYRALAREVVRLSKLEDLKSQQDEQRREIARLEEAGG